MIYDLFLTRFSPATPSRCGNSEDAKTSTPLPVHHSRIVFLPRLDHGHHASSNSARIISHPAGQTIEQFTYPRSRCADHTLLPILIPPISPITLDLDCSTTPTHVHRPCNSLDAQDVLVRYTCLNHTRPSCRRRSASSFVACPHSLDCLTHSLTPKDFLIRHALACL